MNDVTEVDEGCEHCGEPVAANGLCQHHLDQETGSFYEAGSEIRAMLNDC